MLWNYLCVAAVILLIALIWIGIYDSNRFVVKTYRFADPRIRRKCRAVVLADLHNKSFGRENALLLEAVDQVRPDFILVAGDLVTARPGASLSVAEDLLGKLTARWPVYFANGNHEHRMKLYPQTYGDLAERFAGVLENTGVRLLVNGRAELPEYGITLFGSEIDRFYYKRFRVQNMDVSYLREILGNPETGNYNILLAHNPDYFPQYAEWGADLVLSGHVHGGVVRVPIWGKGVAAPSVRLFPKYDGGLFREGDSAMVLSRGLGIHTIPFRLFNPGELVVLELGEQADGSDEKAGSSAGE